MSVLLFYLHVFILISAYVYLNMYTHFPLLPYSYTFIAIFICIVCVVFYFYTHVFVCFFLFPKLNRHLCTMSIDVIIPLLMS